MVASELEKKLEIGTVKAVAVDQTSVAGLGKAVFIERTVGKLHASLLKELVPI